MKLLDDNDIYDDSYLYDNEMSSYLHNLPLESRELVFNRNSYGACADCNMKPQDYIDYELDELPHNKCKQYCMYSPQERAAYKERFPNCECVKIKNIAMVHREVVVLMVRLVIRMGILD